MNLTWLGAAAPGYLSLMVSLGALVIAARSLRVSKVAASNAIRPVLTIKLVGGDRPKPTEFGIILRNQGAGPAVIRRCIYYAPHESPKERDLGSALRFAIPHYQSHVLSIKGLARGEVIEKGEKLTVAQISVEGFHDREAHRAYTDLASLRFDIQYESLAGETYIASYKG